MPKKNSMPVKDRAAPPGVETGDERLSAERCRVIHRIMVRSRVMEERMIKMSKSGEGYFWIGGPGEEAFNACLGLQIKMGEGPAFDFLHLHYRNSATMVAMGMELIDCIRQMGMRWTDPFSAGRNFPSHFSRKEWNVLPVSSVIEVQFAMAPGTALMQKRQEGGDGVTIVVGGDAGAAEGDFTSCMIWATRPGNELPVVMITMNNAFGISTSHCSQHSCEHSIERGKAFGIPGEVVDGNDPVASWYAVERALRYARSTRRPFMLEPMVSRLYGHSSSSGAPHSGDADCITQFEDKLLSSGVLEQSAIDQVHEEAAAEVDAAVDQAMKEPPPRAEDVERFTYAPSKVDAVYPDDYDGLPK
jgi:2-oxoisovalerate dehydrogenase E1 component alpha subunit